MIDYFLPVFGMLTIPGTQRCGDTYYRGRLNTSPNGSRERPPAELNKVVELLWFCECDVWSELTGVWKS